MLIADAVVIQVTGADLIGAVGTAAVGIAGGLTGAARLLVGYLRSKDEAAAAERERDTAERKRDTARSRRAFKRITAILAGISRRLDAVEGRSAVHPALPSPPKV